MGCEPELLKIKSRPAKARKLNLPKGVPPLTSLYMYISGSCNLACRHCWIEPNYQADNKNGKFLKLEYVKKAIKEAIPLGLQSIKLTGGEPMLHPQFRQIVEHTDSQKIGMVMETNGTLIDDKIAQFLKSRKYFSFVSVSLDGAKPETHDKLRGVKGSYQKAVKGIKALVKAGFHPQMICTLHKGNIAELEDVVKLAQKLDCGSVKFNHVQQMGRGDNFNKEQGLSILKLIQSFNKIENQIKSKYNISIFFDIPMAFLSIKQLLSGSLCHCTVHNILGIIANGEMAICGVGATTPELVLGHVAINNIKDVWINNKFLKDLRNKVPNELEGICSICIHRNICLGSCIANNFYINKKINSEFYFCAKSDKMNLFPSSRKNIREVKFYEI